MSKQKRDISDLTLPLMGLLLIIAVVIYLFTRGSAGITGAKALTLVGAEFWVIAIIFGIIGIAALIYLLRIKGDIGIPAGRKVLYLALVLLCLCTPWAKACTVKEDPVTAPKYDPTSKTDTIYPVIDINEKGADKRAA